jgi:hypothetical protein
MRADDGLAHWTHVLTGLDPDRVGVARREVASWGWEHTDREFLDDTVDAAVASTLLVEAVDRIQTHGVERARLLKKIRLDREVWGTWAEFRAADILLRTIYPDAELRLEEGKSRGAQADLRFVAAGSDAESVEVKAVGLSDQEVAFSRRMADALPRMLPPIGAVTGHAELDAPAPLLGRTTRRAVNRDAKRAAGRVPRYPTGLRSAVIVGHGSESSYARRVARRVEQSVRQLPRTEPCWVAIYWSNGAPIKDVLDAVDWSAIPAHVLGVFFVGSCVAFPHREIHIYASAMPRDASRDDQTSVNSIVNLDELARLILERFERSSGVRPSLLQVGRRTILKRDGTKRILPFNLLIDADPVDLGSKLRSAR